ELPLGGQPQPAGTQHLGERIGPHTTDPIRLAAMTRVLAVLGAGVVPADTPILRADDLGALRGDGIFETLHVRHGTPWLLDEHLKRMSASAVRMAIPLPGRDALAALAAQAC